MNTHLLPKLTRVLAAPVAAAVILGGAVGMAADANASTQSGAHDNTAGATHTPHRTVDPRAVAKITNLVEART